MCASEFWSGLGMGLFIGAFLGMAIVAMCIAARESERRIERMKRMRREYHE